MGLVSLSKEKETHSRFLCPVRIQQEGVPRRLFPPDIVFARALIFDFPASRMVRHKCFLFKPPSLWYIIVAAELRYSSN